MLLNAAEAASIFCASARRFPLRGRPSPRLAAGFLRRRTILTLTLAGWDAQSAVLRVQCRQAPFLPDARRFGQTVTSLSEAIAVFWPLGYALTGRRQAVETTIPGMHRAVQRPTELSTGSLLKGAATTFQQHVRRA